MVYIGEIILLTSCWECIGYDLVTELYINVSDAERPIAMAEIEKVVVESAMASYDNASNGNRTRGGLKKASEA